MKGKEMVFLLTRTSLWFAESTCPLQAPYLLRVPFLKAVASRGLEQNRCCDERYSFRLTACSVVAQSVGEIEYSV